MPSKAVVLDANILVSAVLGQPVRRILESHADGKRTGFKINVPSSLMHCRWIGQSHATYVFGLLTTFAATLKKDQRRTREYVNANPRKTARDIRHVHPEAPPKPPTPERLQHAKNTT